MAKINVNELTREQIENAMACETAYDESRSDLSQAYMAELVDIELDGETLKQAAGGGCYTDYSPEKGEYGEEPHKLKC